MTIIGLTGRIGSGKTTTAKLLTRKLGFIWLSFADPIKNALEAMIGYTFHGLTEDQKNELIPHIGVTPRRMMQTLGTEWGRNLICQDLWLILMRERIEQYIELYKNCNIIIDDVRFLNEAKLLRDTILGPTGVHHCYIVEMRNTTKNNNDAHSSESGIDRSLIDMTIDIPQSEESILETFRSLLKEGPPRL